ncbi:TetR/AcrR family transcriptional regulator [Nocardioides islandensis]|uniref:TetR/AcrR family transcriptional regulator n=1 Tax=Nocardioides islandensis TaxID=433663 RepID=A0A930YC64_9ACTN|nr:TetR/AcrR family transcriptional regulator [Nocardioides islandensis]MBF4762836.1 TetR/AcrR family transcriptional regulator [Nocardioides islandensis]
MRADAQRNRDRIVEVARVVFRERGYDASLDDIAKKAGVGPGTLYRHFPTRDALLDAVMQAWVDGVTETTDKALTFEGPAREFLIGWFEAYVALISMHKGGPAKLTSAMGDEQSPISHKTRVLVAATQRVVDHLQARGALREDVEALQMCRMVGGVAVIADQSDLSADEVRPMLAVLADGMLRPTGG